MEIVGQEDKRQIFALLTCFMSGKISPPQRLYQGKTQHCTPTSVRFPKGWHVHYSKNHWSNEITMWRFVDTILLPYINKWLTPLIYLQNSLSCVWLIFLLPTERNRFPKKQKERKTELSPNSFQVGVLESCSHWISIQRPIKKNHLWPGMIQKWKKNVNCKYFGYI